MTLDLLTTSVEVRCAAFKLTDFCIFWHIASEGKILLYYKEAFLPRVLVIPTRVLYHYHHHVEGIDFRVAELEVFLKLEVFQGFSTDILVIIWFKIS